MDRAIAARIREWDDRPVSGGYRGLQELADASFTGAVTNGTAWLYLLNGRIVGARDGAISSFEGADATAYVAPDPSLPLLYAMQERDGEPRAKYYTDDNPLSEVHETLVEAGFTGYIELSENVLSGDYYVVYYGGKSMSVAFVGNAGKLVTGDEAFRQAADEVGIYAVMDVELDVRNVPEVEASAEAGDAEGAPEPADEPEPAEAADEEAAPPEPDPAEAEEAPAEPADEAASEPEPETPPESPAEAEEAPEGSSDTDDPFSQEAAWRETRTIPALDPDESSQPQPAEDGGQQPAEAAPEPEPQPEPSPADAPSEAPEEGRLAELEAAIEAQSETIEALESKLDSTSAEAEQLREERAALESELEAARSGEAAPESAPPGETLDPETALDQTDLFVRYDSKGKATLETAHDGESDREAVVDNLRIDYHTRFEEVAVTVAGQPFEAFLTDTLEYRFVDWLVTEFLFEIQDTGSQRGLREVFDAIPLVDRVEFQGTVTWRDQEAGETYSESFDVVCRDRMGGALMVANLNDVRDPATGEMMESLVEGASTVAEGTESLGGAFMVTSSFFRPDALETTSEVTGGGLLAREKRWSYVKLSRRHGYHLCLVEARGDDFHVAVPEL